MSNSDSLSPLFSTQFGEDEEVVSEESLYPLGAVAEGIKKEGRLQIWI